MRWKMEREAGLITAVYDKPGSGRVRRRRTLIGCSTERGGVGGGGLFTQVQWWPRSNAGRCNGPCSDAGVCVLILKMLKSEKRLQIEISSVPLSHKKSPKISAIFPEIDGFWAYLSKELTAQTMKSLSKKGDERLLAFASFCTLSLSLCLAVESAILSCDVLWQQIWKRPYSLPYILSVRLQ